MHEWMLTTNRPLAPFASAEEVDLTVTHTLPDLFPVSPLIDLRPLHIYNLDNNTGNNIRGSVAISPVLFLFFKKSTQNSLL